MKKSGAKQAEIVDWYKVMPKKYLLKSHNPNYEIHGIKLPFRMLIIGGSGAGKTQTLLSLLHNFGNTFQNLFVITKNKDEPLYNYLADKSGKDGNVQILEGIDKAPDLDSLDKNEQTLIVMDDLVLERNQDKLSEYFLRARKLNCSLVYLSQKYFAVPSMIRQNLTYLIIKRLNTLGDLFRIMREYSLGVDKEELKKIYDASTDTKQNFLLVDLEESPENRFRKNFNEIFEISAK